MRAAIITSSDSGYAGKREDVSGPVIAEMVRDQFRSVCHLPAVFLCIGKTLFDKKER